MDRAQGRDDVMYVYDRVCTKNAKKRHLYHEYGVRRGGTSTNDRTENAARVARPFGADFARTQRERARVAQSSRRPSNRSAGINSYTHRNARSGEAVRQRPLKIMLDRMINLFESIEERGKKDELIAKKRALAIKKFAEYRRIILTSLLLVLTTAVFVYLNYRFMFVVTDLSADGSSVYSPEEILSASGVSEGDNLYSFKVGDAADDIMFYCPYIKSVKIERVMPKAVSITVTDDTAVYYANIYGDTLLLSSGLRVLGIADEESLEDMTELILPPVSYSVTGRTLQFTDSKNDRYVRNVISSAGVSYLGKNGAIDSIDLSDEHDITMISEGRYFLKFGGEEDCDLKLRMAYKTITDKQFDKKSPAARLDLSTVGEASVIYDMHLNTESR